ncbi:MAG TPA: TetR/AcrR family transcriptional regulator [Propionibacteriaceae bacterium]
MPEARPRNYHHGDLRAALVHAGVELAHEGGLASVTLREATRRAGVSVGAAYRHFANHESLLFAVGGVALADLARAIERRQAEVGGGTDLERALGMLSAVGLGYIDFALDDPGAFEAAMFGLFTLEHTAIEPARGETGRTPYELLIDAVTGLVSLGALRAEESFTVAITCWSTVHGFAALATRGPLRELPREALDDQAADVVRTLVAGLLP